MHFTLPLATLLATTASALPQPHWRQPPPTHGSFQEHIAITSYTLQKSNSTIQSLSFHITAPHGKNVTCATTAPLAVLPTGILPCTGDSSYRFAVGKVNAAAPAAAPAAQHNGTAPAAPGAGKFPKDPNQYELTLLHGTIEKGKWGRAVVPAYCHAGGWGVEDVTCSQVSPASPYGVTLWG